MKIWSLLKHGNLTTGNKYCGKEEKLLLRSNFSSFPQYFCLFVLRFYGPVNPMGSCRARSVYLTTRLLGWLSPLSGKPILCRLFCEKLITTYLFFELLRKINLEKIKKSTLSVFYFDLSFLEGQVNLVISTSLISNNRLSRGENLVPA